MMVLTILKRMSRITITTHEIFTEYCLFGIFDNESIRQTLQDVWISSDFKRNQAKLYNLLAADLSGVSTTGVRDVNKLNRQLYSDTVRHPIALLAEDGLEHFLLCLFNRLSEDLIPNVRVFRDYNQAVAWVSSEGTRHS